MDPALKDAQLAAQFNALIDKYQLNGSGINDFRKATEDFEMDIADNCDCPEKRGEEGHVKECTCDD